MAVKGLKLQGCGYSIINNLLEDINEQSCIQFAKYAENTLLFSEDLYMCIVLFNNLLTGHITEDQ